MKKEMLIKEIVRLLKEKDNISTLRMVYLFLLKI